jgi:formate C-acetyltransferase
MRGVLDTYEQGGGQSIQFNVFDTDTLRKAQEDPESYRNLQVRVCGWNEYFVKMTKQKQDDFIKRCQNVN